MKKQVSIILIALIALVIAGCSGSKKMSKVEGFEKFSKDFYKDSSFHYSRIIFPLEMVEYLGNIKPDPEAEYQPNVKTNQFTEESLPRMIKSFKEYPDLYERKVDTTATGFDEKIYIPNSGYIETRSFTLQDKKWYLRHITIMNL